MKQNADERRRSRRAGMGRRPPPPRPPPTDPPPKPPRPFRRFLLWLGGGIFTVTGIVLGVWLTANYAPDLEVVIDEGPKMLKKDTKIHGKYKTVLLEVQFKVRNDGLRDGALARCEVAPLGVHDFPKVEMTHIDRRPLAWRETGVRVIEFRYQEAAVMSIAQDIISWQIDCWDTAGTYVGGLNAASVLRKGDKPEPPPLDLLKPNRLKD